MNQVWICEKTGKLLHRTQNGGSDCRLLTNTQTTAAGQIDSDFERLVWWLGGAAVFADDRPALNHFHPETSDMLTVRCTRQPYLTLHRTIGQSPRAFLEAGSDTYQFPWADLITLREAVIQTIPLLSPPWEILWDTSLGASRQVSLTWNRWKQGGWQMLLSWAAYMLLKRMIYTGEPLLYQGEVGQLAAQPIPRQRVREAIRDGRLFAFCFPGRATRQWGIPQSAALQWTEQYGMRVN